MGRKWMAIRDMDIAAEIIGVNPLQAKLTAFAVSSFFIGISGALFFSVYLGAVEVGEAFGIQKSFLVLFMVIIGGLGSIFGSFAGAGFLVLLPVALKVIGVDLLGWPTDIVAHLQLVIIGALIMFFLIKRTAWFGPVLAHCQREITPVAVSVLTGADLQVGVAPST